jgi:hypothetical protein
VVGGGATDFTSTVPKDKLPLFLEAYNAAINNVFYCALGLASLAFVSSFFVEWKTVKKSQEAAQPEAI